MATIRAVRGRPGAEGARLEECLIRARRASSLSRTTRSCEPLRRILVGAGYQVALAPDGQQGLHLGLTRTFDVLLVDRGLPAIDGVDLIGRLRRRGVATPALILSAFGSIGDRVAGLDAGAEDYLVKPFDVDELLAWLRGAAPAHPDRTEQVSPGAASLDLASRSVRRRDGVRGGAVRTGGRAAGHAEPPGPAGYSAGRSCASGCSTPPNLSLRSRGHLRVLRAAQARLGQHPHGPWTATGAGTL